MNRNLDVLVIELIALLKAGVNIVEAVGVLRSTAVEPSEIERLQKLEHCIQAGQTVSVGLQTAYPDVPRLLIALVRAHETTGYLIHAFSSYREHQERATFIKQRLVTAAIYPVLLLVVGLGVLAYLILSILPKFAKIFEDIGRDLPSGSATLFELGNWISGHSTTVYALVGILSIWMLLVWFYRPWRESMVETFLSIPWVARWYKKVELSQYFRTQGLLFSAGLPVHEVMALAAEVLFGKSRTAAIEAGKQVEVGVPFSEALLASGMTDPVSSRLLRASEGTGSNAAVLESCAEILEAQSWRQLDRATRLFEPLIMVFIGLSIGTIVILMYLPIFDISTALQR